MVARTSCLICRSRCPQCLDSLAVLVVFDFLRRLRLQMVNIWVICGSCTSHESGIIEVYVRLRTPQEHKQTSKLLEQWGLENRDAKKGSPTGFVIQKFYSSMVKWQKINSTEQKFCDAVACFKVLAILVSLYIFSRSCYLCIMQDTSYT